jgi:hypothetical protein
MWLSLKLSANDLRHVEVLLLCQQQRVQALLEVAGTVAVRPVQGYQINARREVTCSGLPERDCAMRFFTNVFSSNDHIWGGDSVSL